MGFANLKPKMTPSSITSDTFLRSTGSANAEGGVLSALRRAATETGTDFGYLLQTAMRESSLNPGAKASSSSATGLFQFIEQTWLGTVQKHGAEHGLKTYADAIQVGNDGRFRVADQSMRQEILALRKDPETAALMAGEMTSEMRGDMETALGRGVSAGELYVAHFLGPKAAIKLIKASEATPGASAADMFPQAAAANRSIFYRNGQERSVAGVVAALKAKHSDVAATKEVMVAKAEVPADNVSTKGLRGSFVDVAPASSGSPFHKLGEQVMVMAPLMVQLLASLDPTPHLAASILGDEPRLRRSEDLI